MSRFALDTNTVICFLKNQGNVAERWLAQSRPTMFLPTVVVSELEFSVLNSSSPHKRRRQLTSLVETLQLLPFDYDSALHAAEIRLALARKGTPIGPADLMIAATARAHDATLVTRNLREFSRVPNLEIENWFSDNE